ncbi:myb-like protein X [Rhinichthys klamathensis goyatoka]|uniref:myb-like protein X n=1 Tax=Rhinichthys klamathensis goyatoka TaxID=3034132 RepID=UPI0024B60BFC|nr:myb-like protein X [Rhinichthys klamathensis goyatoka]
MKSMREVNLDTYSLSLLTAKEDILNPRSSTNWALFAYDGIMNRLKLADSGVGGLKELSTKLHPIRPLYGMCRVGTAQPCIVMILWVGNEVDEYRKAECASHVPAIRNFFKEVHIFLPAHTLDEITEERICTLAYNAAVVTKGPRGRPGRRVEDRQAIVGTNYKRTIAAAEIQRIQRDSFWAQAEREEEERKKEEQRRAAEDRRQRERERMLQEKRDTMERDRRLNEKEQKIKEQRRIQAKMEAEGHKQEKLKWEHQEREREEEEVRARYVRSESEEKFSEAAALVSQRVANTREFFRQLSSTSVHTASSPSSPYPVRGLCRQVHRSQTDSLFSFNESASSPPASPYRSSSPYFQSVPTSQNPTLFTNTAASSLQNCATVSIKSQIHLSSSKIMESCAVTAAGPAPLLQTQPPSTDANESETETPIGDILDSLVFYPTPVTAEQLKTGESEMVDEFPPPPSGFENSPEPVVNQPETLVDPLDTPMSSLPPSSLLVPEPPARPLPALPVAPRMLKDLEPGRDFTARASVIPTVEEDVEEKNEEREIKDGGKDVPGKDGERRGQEKGKGGEKEEEEHDGMIMGKHESEKESNGKRMEKRESGKEQDGKMLEERVSGKEQDGKMLEERESGKEEDGKMLVERDYGKEQDGKKLEECESGKEQDGKMVEERESGKDQDGKMLVERDYGKEHDGKMLEERDCGKEQDGEMVEERESGKEEDGKMLVERDYGKEQDGKKLEECESGKEQDGKMVEGCGSGKEHDGKMLEERDCGKEQDGEMVEERESGKDQDGKMLEERESGKEQDGEMEEDHGIGKEQDGKKLEECESGKEQDGKMLEERVSGKEQDGKMLEERESEKEEDGKMLVERDYGKEQDEKKLEECESGKEQDGKMLEERECGKEQDGKIMEEEESEKIQHAKIMLECVLEKEQDREITEKYEEDGKSLKECENEKIMEEHEQDGKIVNVFDNENEQDGKNMEAFEAEKYGKMMEECGQENKQYGKKLDVRKCEEEHDSEKEQDCKMIDELDAKILLEHMRGKEQDGMNVEAFDRKIEQDGKSMEVFETAQTQYVKRMEECGQENEQDRKIVEKREDEHDSEKEQGGEIDGKIVEKHGSEEKQDRKIVDAFNSEKETSMEVFETENIQYVKMMEKYGQEDAQDGKIVEKCEKEHDNEKEQDGKIVVKHEDGKSPEEHESEKKQDWKMIEDKVQKQIQDGDIIEEHVFETEKIKYVKITEDCGQENEKNGKIVDKCEEEYESGKVQDLTIIQSHDDEDQDGRRLDEQDWEIMEELERGKIQNTNMMFEYMREKEQDCKIGESHEDRKSLEERKELNWKMTEEYGNIMEEHEREKGQGGMMEKRKIQDNKRMSRVDVDRTVNVTVLREEEIIKRDEATEEAVEQVKSDHGNEKEEMNTPLIHTEESSADTLFSQHSPLFPESRATEPPQCNDTSIPESILSTQDKNEPQISSSHQINLPTIQIESDLSNLSIQRDSDDMREKTYESVDSQASSKNSPDASSAERGPNTETHVEQTKIVDGTNGLAEGINTGCEKSPISENQARIGQSDEREGLVPVSHFLQDPDTAIGLKHCTHQLDLTNDISDVEEGEEAISLIVRDTEVEQILKCESDHENEDLKHTFLQDCKAITETPCNMRNDKTASDR